MQIGDDRCLELKTQRKCCFVIKGALRACQIFVISASCRRQRSPSKLFFIDVAEKCRLKLLNTELIGVTYSLGFKQKDIEIKVIKWIRWQTN